MTPRLPRAPAPGLRLRLAGWALGLCLLAPAVHAEELAQAEAPAPMFRLPVYNAEAVGAPMVGLDRFVGPDAADKDARVLLVSFSASFCGPCKKEMPFLQSLHTRFANRGLRVLMVSIDSEEEGQKAMAGLIEEHGVTFPVLKDRFNIVARRWLGAQSPLPSVFVVRPDGRIAAVHRGYSDEGSVLLAGAVGSALGVDVAAELKPVVQAAPVAEAVAAPKAEAAQKGASADTPRKRRRAR